MNKQGYFPGLHALRFFAASFVIIHHVEQYKSWQGRDSIWGNTMVDHLGHMPVGFFFVLSGFLITYFLIQEVQKRETINLRFFYWKRIIRLWPVYFLIVLLSLSVMPLITNGFAEKQFDFSNGVLVALILFIPNLLRIIHPNLVGGNQLWSVGVEEQFYLVWPLLIVSFSKHILKFLLGFITLKIATQEVLGLMSHNIDSLQPVYFLLKIFPVEQMAIGGVGATWIVRRSNYLKGLQSNSAFIASITLIACLFFYHENWMFRSLLEGAGFLIIIVNIISRPSIYYVLESKWLKRMGDASYGIYMYHTVVIALIMSLLNRVELYPFDYNILLYTGSVSITFLLARGSFLYFEKPFLRLKNVKWTWGKKAFAE